MRTIAIAFALLLTLASILVIPEPATADTTAIVQPNPGSTTGRCNFVDTLDTQVVVAHYNTANQVVVAYSSNKGVSWANSATGITLTACQTLFVRLLDFDSWRIYYWTGGGSGALRAMATDDAGFSWVDSLVDNGVSLTASGGVVLCSLANVNSWTTAILDFEETSATTFAYGFSSRCNSVGSVCTAANTRHVYVIRAYTGTEWRTAYVTPAVLTDSGSCTATGSICSGTFDLTDTEGLDGTIVYSVSVGFPIRVVINNGVTLSTTSTLDDAFSALPSRTCNSRIVRGANNILVGAGSPQTWFSLVPIGASTFQAYDTMAPVNVANGPYFVGAVKSGPREAFVQSEDSSNPLVMYASCDVGATWTRIPLYGASGTYPSVAGAAPFGASGEWAVAFRYVDTIGYVRNYETGTCAGVPPVPGSTPSDPNAFNNYPFFCAVKGNAKFGYNYVEGVQRALGGSLNQDTGDASGLFKDSDALIFSGDHDNYDFLAKMFPTETQAARVHFRIEARAENADSVFRVGFSLVDHAQWDQDDGTDPNIGEHLLDGDAKGDGGNPSSLPSSGAFFNYIEVRFLEVGNDWNIQVYAYNAGQRYALGQAFVGDNPNTATAYSFLVDTRVENPHYAVKRGDGTTISNGVLEKPFVTPGHSGYHIGYPMYAQWYVGYGTNNLFNTNAQTALDAKRDSTHASTCIYDLTGANVGLCVGDCGASGPATTDSGKPDSTLDASSPDNPLNQPATVVARPELAKGRSAEVKILLGFMLIGALAFVGWAISGGIKSKDEGGWEMAGSGSPAVIFLFAGLGLVIGWFIHSFFIITSIVLGAFGLLPAIYSLTKKTGAGRF